jgi:hypothetical protein
MRDQALEEAQPAAHAPALKAGPVEIEQAVAAIIAKTRQEWILRGTASASSIVVLTREARPARP